MRQSHAALALIRRMDQGQPVWLAQWNPSWNAYALVGGHKRPTESFRECLIREIAEELGWQEGADFTVATTPPVHLEFTAWSESAQQDTAYTMELFEISWISEAASEKAEADIENRWLTEAEIRGMEACDGRAVSVTVSELMEKAGLYRA